MIRQRMESFVLHQPLAQSALGRIKAVLDAPTKSNEKISAEVTRILAEAEEIYAETRKINAETDRLELDNYKGRIEFIRDLREMAMQLERDDWLGVFDGFDVCPKPIEQSE